MRLFSTVLKIFNIPLLKTSMGIIPAEKTAHRLLIWHFPCSSQLKEEPSQPSVCYMNHSKKGVPLRSCTIPIAGEKERIIGLICINFYTDIPLSSLLANFYPGASTPLSGNASATENFTDNTDELIENVLYKIQHQVLNDFAVSPQNKNKEIVTQLYQRGIFNIKDSV